MSIADERPDEDDDDFWDDRDRDYEPDPTDYLEQQAEEEYWRHCDEAHGGKPCTCPRPAGEWGPEPPGGYSDEPPFLRGLEDLMYGMTDEEKLAWCKERAAAESWQHALPSMILDMDKMGIPLNPDLYVLGMGEAMIGGERGVRQFIDGITLASVARTVDRDA